MNNSRLSAAREVLRVCAVAFFRDGHGVERLERASAEELVQEIFLRLWEQPERFDRSRGALRTFLLKDWI